MLVLRVGFVLWGAVNESSPIECYHVYFNLLCEVKASTDVLAMNALTCLVDRVPRIVHACSVCGQLGFCLFFAHGYI
jgi:hypothetical protein